MRSRMIEMQLRKSQLRVGASAPMETETSCSSQKELQRLMTTSKALHIAMEEHRRFREKRLQQQQREAPIIYGPERRNGSAVGRIGLGFNSIEREVLENIEENERKASENVEKNEREASENIEENERKASENIEENERAFVELTNLNNAAREIVACIVVASFRIMTGIYTEHSTNFIHQFMKNVPVTQKQTDWIDFFDRRKVVCITISVLLTGFLIDTMGRLRTLQIGAILSMIGWIHIVLAFKAPMFLVGLSLSRLAIVLMTSSGIVYITEMARPELRGAMILFGLTLEFLGKLLYLKGAYLHWRLIAGISIIYMVVSIIAMQFLVPESPVWLVSKWRIDDARKSLQWLYKNETAYGNTSVAEMQFNTIIREHEIKLSKQRRSKYGSAFNMLWGFLKPTGWKPMAILFLLFSFQQFSGNNFYGNNFYGNNFYGNNFYGNNFYGNNFSGNNFYGNNFYMMHWLNEVGASVDVKLTLVCINVTHFLCSMMSIWLLWRYKRRPLCIISSLGMTVCMIVSGYILKMKNGDNNGYWVPVICLLLSVCTSMVGMSTVPWTMTAELFPTEIRGIAHSISYSMANLLMFAALQSYRSLQTFLGGTYAAQWCFAGVSMGATVFVLLMLPETHGKKLSEIEEYFYNNFLALGAEMKDEKRGAKRRAQQNAKSTESLNSKPESV